MGNCYMVIDMEEDVIAAAAAEFGEERSVIFVLLKFRRRRLWPRKHSFFLVVVLHIS